MTSVVTVIKVTSEEIFEEAKYSFQVGIRLNKLASRSFSPSVAEQVCRICTSTLKDLTQYFREPSWKTW